MDRFYYSIYGTFIEQFIVLKKGLGYKYLNGALILSQFDRFAHEKEISCLEISSDLSDAWCGKRLNESDSSRYVRLGIFRQFSLFMCSLGYRSYVPDTPHRNRTYIPYIFSKEQIAALLEAADHLQWKVSHPRSCIFVIPTLLRLMYGTGLRISEACSLLYDDVNLDDRHITLRNCKNGQDRIVPISQSVAEVCRGYLAYRSHYVGLNINNPGYFFMMIDGKRCNETTIYTWFRKVVYRAGISHGGKGYGPRLHDLRHTFSVHTLAVMAESGMDLYHSLPILSTYLGHQSLSATDKYVRLTADMYPLLIENTNKLYPYMFPEISSHHDHETD